MIKLKPYPRQMKYFCDKFIGLLAEKVLAPLVNLLQLCLGLELFITEHVLMVTDTIMSIPCCTFAEICFQGREKLPIILPMQTVQFKSGEQKFL